MPTSRESTRSSPDPPIPVAFTLGHDAVRRIDPDRAEPPRQGLTPVQLGPALHYPLGDGTDPHAWTTFQRLTHHVKQASAVPEP